MPRAKETNWPYRTVEMADLVPGKEVVMVDLSPWPDQTSNRRNFDRTTDPAVIGAIIRMDDPPLRDALEPTVYYHTVKPYWEGQCFVPLSRFLGNNGHDQDRFIRYWVKDEN